MSMFVRQIGHPAPIDLKVSMQMSQKRTCPHGTNAIPERRAIKQTSRRCIAGIQLDVDAIGDECCAIVWDKFLQRQLAIHAIHFVDRFRAEFVRHCQVGQFPPPTLCLSMLGW